MRWRTGYTWGLLAPASTRHVPDGSHGFYKRPAVPVEMGNSATTVEVDDLLRDVLKVVLLIGELAKEEQVRVEAVLNYFLHVFHSQKNALTTAKVSCAQIDFLRGSFTAKEDRVRMADAEAKRARYETYQLRE